MNILLIGNGGREHALAWKIRQSKLTGKLYIAPGNAGTANEGENLPIRPDDFVAMGKACMEKGIELVIVGPEVPLVNGVRDYFQKTAGLESILIVGPGAVGAQLEGSKDFSKQFMVRHGIPTAKAKSFSEQKLAEGLAYLESCKMPIVLKADGLAAGKGVIISENLQHARETLQDMLGNHLFGSASARVLVEEFLSGIELSVFILTDGDSYVLLPEAKDYKRIGEQDKGLNTGGMGAVSPVPFADAEFMSKVKIRIIEPTLAGLKAEQIPYQGFIFFGLINVGGDPFVIEYNARMGDPETEAVIPRIDSDLVELLAACAKGTLKNKSIVISKEFTVTVMIASGGYPGDYSKGKRMEFTDHAPGALMFHAGTKLESDGIVTDGGRVIAVTGKGSSLEAARADAYRGITSISFDQAYFRRDIGVDLLK
jgi:phosphoribosylamine--glycine ligase